MTLPKNAPLPDRPCLVVTGAAGRIGRALRSIWGDKLAETLPICWFSRDGRAAAERAWQIGQNPPPALPLGSIVLHLAGKTGGPGVGDNVPLTRAVCEAARGHVFVMSTAAVYAPGVGLSEEDVPGPVNPYGLAKLAAERAALEVCGAGLTLLRLANLAGADALLGNAVPGRVVVLDPIAGQAGGPERSYIGPRVLAGVLEALILRAARGEDLPLVLNVAQQPPVAMADLLAARGQDWVFGPVRDGAVGRVVLDTSRLAGLVDLPLTDAAALIADLDTLSGWPK